MQKKGEKAMKREEWKRSYKRICCHRSRDCALRMQPGKRHTGRKMPGRGPVPGGAGV